MGKSIAELEVQLELQSAQFEAAAKQFDRELKKMEKNTARTAQSFKKFEIQIKNLAKGLALAAAAYATAFAGRAGKDALEFGDNIAKTAAKVGVSVEELQKLRFAAAQSGVDIRTLDMGLQRFSRRIGEVSQGSGELLKTWNKLGIELYDAEGNLRPTNELLGEYAEAIKNAGSAQEQLLLTFKAVDSEAAGLVNLFRLGKEGMEDLKNAAVELGLVLDEGTASKAEALTDELNILTTQLKVGVTRAFIDASVAALDFFNIAYDEESAADRLREITEEIGEAARNFAMYSDWGDQLGADQAAAEIGKLQQEYSELTEVIERYRKRRELLEKSESQGATRTTSEAEAVNRLKEEIRGLETPTEAFRRKMDEAYALTKDALDPLAIEDYYKYIERLAEEWVDATGAADNYGARVAAVLKETDSTELLNQQAAALGVLYSALEKASDPAQIERIMEMIEAISFADIDTDPPEDMVSKWEETLGDIKDAIDGFVSDFTNKLVDGLVEGELAFDDFAKNILSTIAKLMLNKIFTQFFDLVLGSIPGFGGTAGSGTNTIGGGVGGGDTGRMGRAVTDPAPLPMLSSNSRGGVPSLNSSPVTVNVINNGNSEVEVEERKTSRGIEIDVLIKQAVNRGIASGDFDNSMRAAYGTRRMAY